MKIIKKIRLKKDTPDHRAGDLFVLMSNNGIYEIDAGEDDHSVFHGGDIDNFDEWFEEVGKPRYRRKLVKAVHGKGTRINYMVVRTLYLPVVEWCSEHKTAFRMEPGDVAGFVGYDEDVIGYINQMVKLGYIEVEDNPNIVWEDEDEQDD